MADNWLEKRYEECFGQNAGKKAPRKAAANPSLDSLLLRNRSCRGYDSSYIVSDEELMRIIGVADKVGSACNQQVLRFRKVLSGEADKVNAHIRLGGALKELGLPLPGTAPNAFIVICSTIGRTHWADVDLGIMAQSMLLKATEMHLAGICIGAFDKEAIIASLNLPEGLEPVLILAIGKSIEHIYLTSISAEENHSYYRKDGIQYVPKVRIEDLLIKNS